MKKITIFLITLSILFINTLVFAQTQRAQFKPGTEPDGFRNIKWGTNPDKIKDMILVKKEGAGGQYRRKNENLKMGNASLKSITYTTIKNKIYNVVIEVNLAHWEPLKKVVFNKHGDGAETMKSCYEWASKDTTMSLLKEKTGGRLIITSLAVMDSTFSGVPLLGTPLYDSCPSESVSYMGVKYYQKCHCEQMEYKYLGADLKRYGAKYKPVAIGTLPSNPNYWKCAVEVEWDSYERRSDSACKMNAKKIRKILHDKGIWGTTYLYCK